MKLTFLSVKGALAPLGHSGKCFATFEDNLRLIG